jgi:cytochrome P450
MGLLRHGEELQRQRKMMAQCLGPSSHKKYLPGAHRTAQEMCLQIAESPKQWKEWVKL